MQPLMSGRLLAVPTTSTSPPVVDRAAAAGVDEATSAMLLSTVRSLMRVATTEEVVGAVMDAVRDMGGSVTPIRSTTTLDFDLSFGMGGPLLADAGQPDVYALLEATMPALVDDAKLSIERIENSPVLDPCGVTDPLTGLGNWALTLRALERMTPGDAVAIIDLENLEHINHFFSEATGDQLLISFARTLRRVARGADAVGRVGGTEFVWLFRSATPPEAESALRRLRGIWEAERSQDEATFSAGVAAVTATGPTEAYMHADAALENAKRAGPNNIFVDA